jgi:UDP-N-acetyl-D-glucosamine dehydrogenase
MPRHVVSLIQDALNERGQAIKGSRILILGVAYKANIDDLRESPALDVIGLLHRKGGEVRYHDPFIPHLAEDGLEMDSVLDLLEEVRLADCVVIITDHTVYDYPRILEAAHCIVDTRNALGDAGRDNPKVVRL